MKRPGILICVCAFALVAVGCTSLHPEAPRLSAAVKARLAPSFYAGAPVSKSGHSQLFTVQREATDKGVEEILNIKPAVEFRKDKPITLAIAAVGPDGVETIRQEDKDAWRAELEKTGCVKVIFISSVILSANPKFHEIRLAAARLHADAMLLYTTVDSTEHKYNLGALMYLTVVGAFFTPGDEYAVLTFAKGACFDVKNEFLEFTVEGEDECRTVRPLYFKDTEQLRIDSHKASLDILRAETVHAIKNRAGVK